MNNKPLRRVVAEFYSKVTNLDKDKNFYNIISKRFQWCKNPKLKGKFLKICKELNLEYVGHGASRVVFKWNNYILKFDTNFKNVMGTASQNELELRTYNKFRGTDIQYLMIPIYGFIKMANGRKVIVTKPVLIENSFNYHNDRINSNEFYSCMQTVIYSTFVDIHHENIGFVFNGIVATDFSPGEMSGINLKWGNGLDGLIKMKPLEWEMFKNDYIKDLRQGAYDVKRIS